MELTAQVGAVNHSKLEKRTFQLLLAADAVAALLARNWAAVSHPNLTASEVISGYHRGGGYSALQRR
jgi:hypothetical protein